MARLRKKVVIDKNFQYRFAAKAIVYPLVTIIMIYAVLFFFAHENNRYIYSMIDNQDNLSNVFLQTPALQNIDNPDIINAQKSFMQNVNQLTKIRKNSDFVLYFLIFMIMVQSIIIFYMAIKITHRICGPIYVMSRNLKEISEGKDVKFRPLRHKDELKDFYDQLRDTIIYLQNKKK